MKGKIDLNNTIKDYHSFIKIDNNEGTITNYNSIKECADANNLDVSSISKRINNKANCYKEYTCLVI